RGSKLPYAEPPARGRARPKPKPPTTEASGVSATEWPADKVERWSLDRLIPYATNARTHTPEQVDRIAASISEWGWTVPILADERGGVIAGHERILSARRIALTEAPGR